MALPTGVAGIPVCGVYCLQSVRAFSFDYDQRIQAHIDYDGSTMRAANECRSQSANTRSRFASFAKFLAADSAATETFYRTMSQANYDTLAATGKLPATSETFISPSLEYAQQYNGVTVQFNVQAGTTDSLLGMGVRNAGLNGGAYGNLPLVQSGWGSSSAFLSWKGMWSMSGWAEARR